MTVEEYDGYAVVNTNDNYVVVIDPEIEFKLMGAVYLGGYSVINKITNITEFMTPSMPEALFTAEQLNANLQSKSWEWRKKDEKAEKVDLDRVVN